MARPYNRFKYLFPPRPKNKISNDYLPDFDNDTYLGQPKLNGSCAVVFIKGNECHVWNRHKEDHVAHYKLEDSEICALNKTDKWMVLAAEYMNKSKKDANGDTWNHKLVIFDILVYEGEELVRTTFQERVELLDKIFGTNDYDKFLYEISENVYRVKSFYGNFSEVYQELVEIDMYEGFVLKRKDAPLERGIKENNNVDTQIKCRKPTKNYTF